MVLDYMSQGYSLTAFAGSIRMARNTVYEWIKRHSEFADAVTRARPARVAALEAKLLRSRKGAETSAAMFALKNADPTEWRDLKTTQHNHNVSVQTLTDQQLFAIASGNQAADGDVIDGEFERVATS
jgi:transposase-like protein